MSLGLLFGGDRSRVPKMGVREIVCVCARYVHICPVVSYGYVKIGEPSKQAVSFLNPFKLTPKRAISNKYTPTLCLICLWRGLPGGEPLPPLTYLVFVGVSSLYHKLTTGHHLPEVCPQ